MTEFEQIYRAYFSDVYLYLKSLTGDAHLAEDLTSDTFFKAMQALPRFQDSGGKVRIWLCQIAKNLYYDHLRKHRRTLPLETLPEADLPAAPHTPETQTEQQDAALRLHRLVHTLPEPYKEVFLLRVFGELSFAQIGTIFGKTGNWACVTYHRARRKLMEMEENQDEK